MAHEAMVARHDRQIRIRHGAKALITADDAVLLVKERHTDGSPFWTLPGGGVHPEETDTEGLRRELREELDCHVLVGETTATIWYAHHSTAATLSTYAVFNCAVTAHPAPNPAEGIFEARWIPIDDLPAATLPQVRLLVT